MKNMKLKKLLSLSALVFVVFVTLAGMTLYFTYWAEATATEQSEISDVLKRESKTIFEPVLPNEHVSLPHDFRFHPDYQHEWWNYFAKVQDKHGKVYNIQWSYFRVATDERDTRGWAKPTIVYLSYCRQFWLACLERAACRSWRDWAGGHDESSFPFMD